MPILYFDKNGTIVTQKLSHHSLILISKDKNRKEKVAIK